MSLMSSTSISLIIVAVIALAYIYRANIQAQYQNYLVKSEIRRQIKAIGGMNHQLKRRIDIMDAQCKADPTACADPTMAAHLTALNAGITTIQTELTTLKTDLTATAKQFATGPDATADAEAFRTDINAQLAILAKRVDTARTDTATAVAAV